MPGFVHLAVDVLPSYGDCAMMQAKHFVFGLGLFWLGLNGMPAQEAVPEVDPIPQDPKAFLEKDYQREMRAWAERSLLKAAQERWKTAPWAEEATALVKEAYKQYELEYADATQCLKALAPRFKALLDQGADDPLLCFLGALALYDERLNWRDAKEALKKARARSHELNAAGHCQLLTFAMEQPGCTGSESEELFNEAIRSVTDGSYGEDEVNVMIRQQMDLLEAVTPKDPNDVTRWQQAIADSAWPEWAKLTLEGAGEVKLAWMKRSSSWAREVNDDQWRGFAEHLKRGRDVLAKANRLRPDRPEAATKMITVCLGESVHLSELRAWFDRAVSAQFDYLPAYKALLWAYRPRWLGSHELMLAFGKACAETRRFETAVPSRLMVACADVVSEVKQPEAVFRHPIVKEAVSLMSRGYLDTAGTPPWTRAMRVSNATMCAWLAGDYPLAKEALTQAGPRLHRTTQNYLGAMLQHEKMLRADVAATLGEYGEAMRHAATPPPEATLEEMRKRLMAVDEKTLSPEALDYFKDGKDLFEFQEGLNKGDWVKITPRQHLSQFGAEGGNWEAENGDLVLTGQDERWVTLFFRVPTKDDLEMRGELVFDVPEDLEFSYGSCGFGPLLRWLPHGVGRSEGGVRFMTFIVKDRSAYTHAYGVSSDKSTRQQRLKLQAVNPFSVKMASQKISYDMNGKTMAQRFALSKMEVENEGGFVGFTAYNIPWGAKVRVKNIEVRKITAKALEPAVVTKPAESAVKRVQESLEAANENDRSIQWAILAAVLVGGFFILRLVKPSEG